MKMRPTHTGYSFLFLALVWIAALAAVYTNHIVDPILIALLLTIMHWLLRLRVWICVMLVEVVFLIGSLSGWKYTVRPELMVIIMIATVILFLVFGGHRVREIPLDDMIRH